MSDKRTIRILKDLAPPELHQAAWKETGLSARWYFGHSSGPEGEIPFWKMDLDDNPVLQRLWEHAKPRCEEHIGQPLRVLRQYANGHTYGQGGAVHRDDFVAGTHTLIYYPMLEWHEDWAGETVYQDENGEVIAAIRPAPNRAVLFDSTIPHAGRAPHRSFGGLRVTIAFKLKTA